MKKTLLAPVSEYAEVAFLDLIDFDGLAEGRITEEQIADRAAEMHQQDLEETLSSLSVQIKDSRNTLLVKADYGTFIGYGLPKDLDSFLNGRRSPMQDCQIREIYSEDGDLHISAAPILSPDEPIDFALRQLKSAGRKAFRNNELMVQEIWDDPSLCMKFEAEGREQMDGHEER